MFCGSTLKNMRDFWYRWSVIGTYPTKCGDLKNIAISHNTKPFLTYAHCQQATITPQGLYAAVPEVIRRPNHPRYKNAKMYTLLPQFVQCCSRHGV